MTNYLLPNQIFPFYNNLVKYLFFCGLLFLSVSIFAAEKATPSVGKKMPEATLEALIKKANKLVSEKAYTQALDIHAQMLTLEPVKKSVSTQGAIVVGTAKVLLKVGKKEEALQKLNNILSNIEAKNEVFYLEALLQKTIVLALLKDFETLEATYQQVLKDYFFEKEGIDIYQNLGKYINAKKAKLRRIEAMQEKQLLQGKVLGLAEQLQEKEAIQRELPQFEAWFAKKDYEKLEKTYILPRGHLRKNEVVMEMFYNYIRFLQWQGKTEYAKKLAYSLAVQPEKKKSYNLNPVETWEVKVLDLVKEKPVKADASK